MHPHVAIPRFGLVQELINHLLIVKLRLGPCFGSETGSGTIDILSLKLQEAADFRRKFRGNRFVPCIKERQPTQKHTHTNKKN